MFLKLKIHKMFIIDSKFSNFVRVDLDSSCMYLSCISSLWCSNV